MSRATAAAALVLLAAAAGHAAPPPADLLRVGDRAPDFTLEDTGGERRTLSSFRGRAVLLTFFATWCRFCEEETRLLSRLYRKHGADGLVVLAVSIDRGGWDTVRDYARARDLPYLVTLDERLEVARRYGVGLLPTNLVVDPDGRVAFLRVGYDKPAEIERACRGGLAKVRRGGPPGRAGRVASGSR